MQNDLAEVLKTSAFESGCVKARVCQGHSSDCTVLVLILALDGDVQTDDGNFFNGTWVLWTFFDH